VVYSASTKVAWPNETLIGIQVGYEVEVVVRSALNHSEKALKVLGLPENSYDRKALCARIPIA